MADVEQEPEPHVNAESDDKKKWCNFCGYSTESLSDYLAHSCVEVIEAKGEKIVPSGRNTC